MPAISIQSLSKTYKGKRGSRVDALQDLTLEIDQGEIFGFLGPNGAGKSTTIKSLMGLIRPTSGRARIMGKDITSTEARRHVGFLPEHPAFYDYLSAEEYLAFVGRAFGMNASEQKRKSEKVLKLLDLWDVRRRPMRGYSKGMVQRLASAPVLIHDPEVYILDEPMSGLDPMGRALVKEIIKDLKRQRKTVFFSTHITADVEAVCDRVGVIVNGRLRVLDTVQNVLRSGVQGYRIQLVSSDDGIEERQVGQDRLHEAMERIWSEGGVIQRVEPYGRTLEDFFLDVVARARGEDQNKVPDHFPQGKT